MQYRALALAAIVFYPLVAAAVQPRVVVEEVAYTFVNPKNGSGPLWSHGCTPIARVGDRVFLSQMETGEGVPLLCNTRWRLLERTAEGWKPLAEAPGYKQREPTVLTTDAKSRLFLYVNDSLMPPGTEYGPCEPHLLAFDLKANPIAPVKISPVWDGPTTYTDHSYRSYAADAQAGHVLMFNIDAKTSVEHYSLLSMAGKVLAVGTASFPIRSCYAQVALQNNNGYMLAIGDIVEPVEEWRKYKFDQTQQHWDYVFRRLFLTVKSAMAPPAPGDQPARGDFPDPLEIANVDATAGYISNQDLWIAPNGDAYIAYTEREVASELMRDKFFPGKSTINNLYLAIVRNGAVAERKVLMPGTAEKQVGSAQFHVAADGAVYLLIYVSGSAPGNYLMPIYPQTDGNQLIPVPFKTPFGSFLLANTRAGNAPSDTIDVMGVAADPNAISYGQIALE